MESITATRDGSGGRRLVGAVGTERKDAASCLDTSLHFCTSFDTWVEKSGHKRRCVRTKYFTDT